MIRPLVPSLVLGLAAGAALAQSPLTPKLVQPPRVTVPAPLGAETLEPETGLPVSPGLGMPGAGDDPRFSLQPGQQGVPTVEDRMDPEQSEAELVKTTLLNRFGGLGFNELRDFRQDGDFYAAEVRRVDGSLAVVRIDPRTGKIELVR